MKVIKHSEYSIRTQFGDYPKRYSTVDEALASIDYQELSFHGSLNVSVIEHVTETPVKEPQ